MNVRLCCGSRVTIARTVSASPALAARSRRGSSPPHNGLPRVCSAASARFDSRLRRLALPRRHAGSQLFGKTFRLTVSSDCGWPSSKLRTKETEYVRRRKALLTSAIRLTRPCLQSSSRSSLSLTDHATRSR